MGTNVVVVTLVRLSVEVVIGSNFVVDVAVVVDGAWVVVPTVGVVVTLKFGTLTLK